MLTPAQARAIKEAAGSLEVAHAMVRAAVDELEANGVQIASHDSILRLRQDLAELLERDVVQRAGAHPD